jgi:ketosteroid isomerase-like protein
MRTWCTLCCIPLLLTCLAFAQQPAGKAVEPAQPATASAQAKLKDLLESKVRAEWEAFKNKDKKGYTDLLADDFVAVETDGEGARNKIHAANELVISPLHNYTLHNFRLITAGPDAAVVTYELTMEFPPKSTVRFLRVWASELWLNREGRWQARYYQETRVK